MKKLLIALMLLGCGTVQAEFFTGNKLYEVCMKGGYVPGDGAKSTVDFGDCIGYISGAADAGWKSEWCPVQGVTRGQVMDIVIKYLRDNPDRRHISADVLVLHALGAAYPCRNRPAGPTTPLNQL
jgi:hypothetical protein